MSLQVVAFIASRLAEMEDAESDLVVYRERVVAFRRAKDPHTDPGKGGVGGSQDYERGEL